MELNRFSDQRSDFGPGSPGSHHTWQIWNVSRPASIRFFINDNVVQGFNPACLRTLFIGLIEITSYCGVPGVPARLDGRDARPSIVPNLMISRTFVQREVTSDDASIEPLDPRT